MLIHDFLCTRVVHHNRPAEYQALRGGPLREPGHVHRPPSRTMPESSLRSFRANVTPHSGSTRAPSCSRTALVGARPGTDCTGPDSAFSHDAGCQRPGVRPRHSRRHAPHHPVGGIQPASRGLNGPPNCLLRCGCAATATGPDHPVLRVTSLWGTAATFPEPTLSPKCSQDWLHFPSFPPVSRSKRPPTSLLGTDANPCTRVRHHIRLPERHLTASDGPWTTCTAPDGPQMITCLHVAGMWLQLS